MKAIRDRLEDLWVRLQLDYEARQYALYIGLFLLSTISGRVSRAWRARHRPAAAAAFAARQEAWKVERQRDEERFARLLGQALADALNERSPR